MERLDEAAVRLAAIVNDENFVSKEGKSNYQVRTLFLGQQHFSFHDCMTSAFWNHSIRQRNTILSTWRWPFQITKLLSDILMMTNVNPKLVAFAAVARAVRPDLPEPGQGELPQCWCHHPRRPDALYRSAGEAMVLHG